MKGRKPAEYKLNANDRRHLNEIVKDGQLIQRVANRARVLLALDRGERIVDILPWVGMSRMAIWLLWRRYLERGVDAIFDDERSGRPPVCPATTTFSRQRQLKFPFSPSLPHVKILLSNLTRCLH